MVNGGSCVLNGQMNGGLTTLHITNVEKRQRNNFLDYLASGWQIGLVAAIDYTASNGNIKYPWSLHYSGPIPNQYEQALLNVGHIVTPYSYEQKFPLFGFGGIPHYMGQNKVMHCFPVNGSQ